MTGSPSRPVILYFGSWSGRLVSDLPRYVDAVRLMFGAEIDPPGAEREGSGRFELQIHAPGNAPTAESAVPPDGMLLGGDSRHLTITTEALHAELQLDVSPVRICIRVRQPEIRPVELDFHFSVVLHKILFLVDRVVLHGAAVRWKDQVSLFIGEKGAGKSTICLALGKAGATILAEDRLVLWKTASGFLLSGGDDRSRVTDQTERHFFAEPLAVPARDFAGTLKKEIRMGDHVASRPFEDFRPDRLCFPRITGRLGLTPAKAQPALLRLMQLTSIHHRFAGAADQTRFLDFLTGFIESVRAYDVELSSDLSDLERLGDLLQGG